MTWWLAATFCLVTWLLTWSSWGYYRLWRNAVAREKRQADEHKREYNRTRDELRDTLALVVSLDADGPTGEKARLRLRRLEPPAL